ncbi:MAG TPA: general secretion pathway protein GspB [Steroidobacteraceae bacterium]|nr:general secretion pathway protein GspB [Steroidobacteraceae bacterium]
MSFILDALKKSELERQRQAIPGLMDGGAPRARPRFPPWAIALTALLAVNLVILLIVLSRGTAPPTAPRGAPAMPASLPSAASATAPPSSSAADSAKSVARARATEHFSPLDPAPVYAPEIPTAGETEGEQRGGAVPAQGAGPLVRAGSRPSGGALPHAMPPPEPALEEASDTEVLPSISEINLGPEALPDLHLDVHVFATRPSERFVYINMRKYREGATLAEGPVLEKIRRDGVVLRYHDLRFLLPRQQ